MASDYTQINDVAAAVDRLKGGGVVAFPTETVYGLGADAMNPAAVARVFALKGRPSHNPLIVHVTGADMARRVAAAWPEEAEALAHAFWPGPLSIVLPRRADVPEAVAAGGPTVAVRCPDHPLALALLFQFGGPLVGPSANKSGRVSPTVAAHVREVFTADEVLVLDGGACPMGIESTVVQLAEGGARILRPGIIGAAELSRVLRHPVGSIQQTGAGGDGPLASPGLLESHYAPRAAAVLVMEDEWDRVRATFRGRVAVVTHRDRILPMPHAVIRLPTDARGYAAGMYAALREADQLSPDLIVVEHPPLGVDEHHPDSATWAAIMDRLRRATTRP